MSGTQNGDCAIHSWNGGIVNMTAEEFWQSSFTAEKVINSKTQDKFPDVLSKH
jgi:hypothetical protein